MVLNHQIDAKLMHEVGKTFYEQFKDKGVTKILTIEASGIALLWHLYILMFLVYLLKG